MLGNEICTYKKLVDYFVRIFEVTDENNTLLENACETKKI